MTQQEVGARLGIDRTTIVTVIDSLEDHGFVERRRSPTDRRAYELTVTAPGEQARQRGQLVVDAAQRRLLEALDDTDRDQLIALLARAFKTT